MVNSFMVDFDMNEEDAVIEAIEELNVRGIDHSDLDLSQQRLGAEGGASLGNHPRDHVTFLLEHLSADCAIQFFEIHT